MEAVAEKPGLLLDAETLAEALDETDDEPPDEPLDFAGEPEPLPDPEPDPTLLEQHPKMGRAGRCGPKRP